MPCTAFTALIAILVFGFPSVVLADTNSRTGHHGLFVQRPMSTMFNGRTWAVNDAAKPFKEKGSFAASPLVPSALFCRGGSSECWACKEVHYREPRQTRRRSEPAHSPRWYRSCSWRAGPRHRRCGQPGLEL
jgi:hypothetical protein